MESANVNKNNVNSTYSGNGSATQSSAVPQQNYLGLISHLSEAFPNKELPSYRRGALEGEGVCATFDVGNTNNYLYSLNAQTCIIVTLYNSTNQKGAVIHIENNIQFLIEKAIEDAINQIGNSDGGEITSTLSGGFLLADSIGEPLKNALAKHGINPTWEQWSFSYCTAHCYGVILDLKTGNVQAFDHSVDGYMSFIEPLWKETKNKNKYPDSLTAVEKRLNVFMMRCKEIAILQRYGTFHYVDPENALKTQPNVTQQDINKKQILIHNLDRRY